MEAKDINRLLVLDTETTGTNYETDQTIEVACSLYDIEHNAPVASFASLLHAESNAAEAINRIPLLLISDSKRVPVTSGVWQTVSDLVDMADVIVAHQTDFDEKFVPKEIAKLKPWACSMSDMDWPFSRLGRGDGLVKLALAHGVAVVSAHRAMTDVDTLVRTFQAAKAMGHDVREMVARSLRPKGLFIAVVPYEEKDKAKEAGFRWNAPEAPNKTWSKRLFLDEADKFPFKTKKVA